MKSYKLITYSEYLLSGLFFSGIFIFFAFFYNSHLHFQEQVQLFLLTDDYFFSKLAFPGGLSGYIGGFLTQFYSLSLIGPLIITLLLLTVQLVTKQILLKINPGDLLFPLSFFPALWAALILCDEFYPLSSIIGYLLALSAALVYVSMKSRTRRYLAGMILLLLTYWFAGGSFLMLMFMMLVSELFFYLRERSSSLQTTFLVKTSSVRGWYYVTYPLLAAVIPLLVKEYLILQPVKLTYMSEFYYNVRTSFPAAIPVFFIIPVLLIVLAGTVTLKERFLKPLLFTQLAVLIVAAAAGFRIWADFGAEEIMTYDHLVRNERWADVLRYSEKKPPRNYLSLAMLNLSLAQTGQMGNRMFSYDQHGINGLFLPFNREYVAPMMGNDVFYHLGLINASQEYAFESMETIPNLGKSVRLISRLAETNLINGHYRVADKYLKLLEKTLFYRNHARELLKISGDEDLINSHPVYGWKRKFMVKNDYFFHVQNIEAVLNRMVKENPDNRIAFEYLMAFYMINKDLRNFVNNIPLLERMNYKEVPVSYQEAIMYVIGLSDNNPLRDPPSYISRTTINRMKAYADIYTAYPDAEDRLKHNFSGTYWYYLHYKEID